MKPLILIFLALLIGFFFSCNNSKKVAGGEKTQIKICVSMDLLEIPLDSVRMDPINIDSLNINGNCLDVFVSYSGGCGEVKFNMYYTNLVQNSFPPQTAIYLSFEDNDHCRAIETKKLTFDLEPFSDYAKNRGIWLNLGNDKNARILYKTDQ